MTHPPLWLIFALPFALMALLVWVGWNYFVPTEFKSTSPIQKVPKSGTWGRMKQRMPQLPWAFNTGSVEGMFRFLGSRRALWLLAPLLMAGFMVALTLSFAKHFNLDPLRSIALAQEGQVSLRLNQEKLLPPPALPPSMFINTQVPFLETADRNWGHLDPAFAQTVLQLFAKMAKRGFPMGLLEGYRSPERQELLASKGPTVTLARANQSKHQFGMAVDLAPMRDGRLVISERDPWAHSAYQALGEEAANLGLTWGGRWVRLADFGHVESASKVVMDSCKKTALK